MVLGTESGFVDSMLLFIVFYLIGYFLFLLVNF